ncbi:MAG TPA: MFS transporter, partial [Actinomycetota bacterium]|nr:MFS transporter [Actinomycetota bacterium]
MNLGGNGHERASPPIQLTAVLTVGLVAATFVQACLAVLSKYLLEDLGLTRTGLGLLLTAFGLSGAAAAPFMGRACDRLGGRTVLAWVFAVSAATLVALGI